MNIIVISLIAIVLFAMTFVAVACCVVSGRCSRMEKEIDSFKSFDSGDNGIDEVN